MNGFKVKVAVALAFASIFSVKSQAMEKISASEVGFPNVNCSNEIVQSLKTHMAVLLVPLITKSAIFSQKKNITSFKIIQREVNFTHDKIPFYPKLKN